MTFQPNSFLICWLSVCLLSVGVAHAQPDSAVRAGFAKVDITPTVPTPMAGYYQGRLSTETHDPLWCRATVLDDGNTRVALVALDLITTTRWLTTETRERIAAKTSIPAANVLLSATHSHTGPVMYDPANSRYQLLGNGNPATEKYMAELPEKIANCVAQALHGLQVVRVHAGVGDEKDLAFNRRFFMNDGTVGWNPGKLNPKIVREAGPTDSTLPVVAFYGEDSKLLGLLSNFSIHLDTVGGTQWSADMPYAMLRSLQEVTGDKCHLQYSTGCCGDVNHIDVRKAFPQKGHEEAARIGTRLAGAALRTLPSLGAAQGAKLHATSTLVTLPAAKHAQQRVAWAKEIADRSQKTPQPPFRDMVEAFRILDIESRNQEPYSVEVQVISLGSDVAWVSLPGEIFVQLGIAIKDGSPFQVTSVHELANGSIGYIPTRQAYPQGNYEVISARCDVGSGELLVDAALDQLREHFVVHANGNIIK
ncbi:neutral/alkaline non-lysosomal ceramidase N-terminal domain-containing protein [Pirellulaceae bacterium SH501]